MKDESYAVSDAKGIDRGSPPCEGASASPLAAEPGSAQPKVAYSPNHRGWVGAVIVGGVVFLVGYAALTSVRNRQEPPADKIADALPPAVNGDLPAVPDDRPAASLSPDALFAKCSPSVAQVVVYGRDGSTLGSGSAFLVSKTGLFATNYHVIEEAHSASIVFADSGKAAVLGVVASDVSADVAIIKVPSLWIDMPPLTLARDELPVGAKVYAIGNPFGLANSLSDGLVSGYRHLEGIRLIQTTAAISPGSSGGPLLAADGRVVGVTTAGFKGGQNLNFAVPASTVTSLLRLVTTDLKMSPLPATRPVESGYEERSIIGRWEITNSDSGLPRGTITYFAEDSSLNVFILVDGKVEKLRGTYNVEKRRLTVKLDKPGVPHIETVTITELTDTALVTVDRDNKVDEFKRVK